MTTGLQVLEEVTLLLCVVGLTLNAKHTLYYFRLVSASILFHNAGVPQRQPLHNCCAVGSMRCCASYLRRGTQGTFSCIFVSFSFYNILYSHASLCALIFLHKRLEKKKTRPVFTNRGRLESPETRRRSARFLAYPHICMWNPHYLHGVNTGRGLGRK